MWPLRQSTASQEVPLGPFLDSTDGNTAETGLTIANTDVKLLKAGATAEANKNSGGATHIAGGRYYAVLDATDTDTVGPMRVSVHVAGALAVWLDCVVYEEAVYDLLFAAGATGKVTLAAGVTHGGAATKLVLEGDVSGAGLSVTSADGDAVLFQSTSSDGDGLHILGDNDGLGLNVEGGTSLGATAAAITGNVTGNLSGSVGSVTGAVGSVAGNVGGNVAGSVASVTAAVTIGTINTGVITAASIAADAITAAKVAADAGTEIATAVWASATRTLTAGTNVDGSSFTAIPWNSAWDAEVQSEVQDAIEVNHLDHFIAVADPGGVVANSSFLAKLVSKNATPAFSSFDNATDSLEALRDRGDAAWTTATGFSTHSAADVWGVATRVLTAGTNIQLPSNGLANVTAWTVAITGNITGNLSGSVGSVTGAINTGAGTITTLDALDTAQDAQHSTTQTALSGKPTLAQILAGGDVDGYSLEETLKLCLAALAGKLSGAATTTVTIRAADDSKARITATVDSDGNRTAVTLDGGG